MSGIEDFLRGCRLWNYNERELSVGHEGYPYTYVIPLWGISDGESRLYKRSERYYNIVHDYPFSYGTGADGRTLYNLGEEEPTFTEWAVYLPEPIPAAVEGVEAVFPTRFIDGVGEVSLESLRLQLGVLEVRGGAALLEGGVVPVVGGRLRVAPGGAVSEIELTGGELVVERSSLRVVGGDVLAFNPANKSETLFRIDDNGSLMLGVGFTTDTDLSVRKIELRTAGSFRGSGGVLQAGKLSVDLSSFAVKEAMFKFVRDDLVPVGLFQLYSTRGVFLQTGAFSLGREEFERIRRLITRVRLTEGVAAAYLFASNDARQWTWVDGHTVRGSATNIHYLSSPASAKYGMLVVAGALDAAADYLTHVSVEWSERYRERIR